MKLNRKRIVMKKIGITGGVGSGKSAVLDVFRNNYNSYVCVADEVAHILEGKGQDCYNELVETFGDGILDEEGNLDKKGFASIIFSSKENLEKVNAIIHPAVKRYILARIAEEEAKGTDYFILEAALLIEDGYLEILDEIWYVYASEEVRRSRLKTSRGYSDEKIDSIMEKQMSEEEFRSKCHRVIDNNTTIEIAQKQIKEILGVI